MLYILNKSGQEGVNQLALLGAEDDEKVVLLVSDGVFLAASFRAARLADMGVEDIYAAEDAVRARAIEVASDVEVVDYDDMAGLVEEHAKIMVL